MHSSSLVELHKKSAPQVNSMYWQKAATGHDIHLCMLCVPQNASGNLTPRMHQATDTP